MTEWYDVIGEGRERRLLDSVIGVMLGLDPGALDASIEEAGRRLTDKIAEDWHEGYLAEHGFTLDDMAGLSVRLGKLTYEQRESLLRYYRQEGKENL